MSPQDKGIDNEGLDPVHWKAAGIGMDDTVDCRKDSGKIHLDFTTAEQQFKIINTDAIAFRNMRDEIENLRAENLRLLQELTIAKAQNVILENINKLKL